jgi:DNA polymerase III alpha subunit (gram-positive type)
MKEIEWLMAIDLEMAQPSGKIIQIGYCIFSIKTGVIKLSKSLYINPKEELTEYINKLTGITQAQVESGYELKDAYEILKADHEAYTDLCNGVQWGSGDTDLLEKQLGIEKGTGIFGRRSIDVKTLVVAYKMSKGMNIQGGLGNTMKKFKIASTGRFHNAEVDAKNTALVYVHILRELKKITLERSSYG